MEAINIKDNLFPIKIDCKNCTSMLEGITCFNNSMHDCWRFSNQTFESGKIYGLISEYQQGCMYLSYLLGGKIDFGDLKIYGNEMELSRADLACISWNLEPSKEPYRKAKVKKSIENALKENNKEDDFKEISKKFILTPQRFDRKLFQLSEERWRACAALGYAKGKRIFYAPYQTSAFYYQMCQSGLLKALKELTNSGAVVLLPVGSDNFIKHIADICIDLNFSHQYDIKRLKQLYQNYTKDNWIH